MRQSPVTVSIAAVHGMLEGTRRRALPVGMFLRGAGIPVELLEKPGARVTSEQYVTLFRLLGDLQNDESMGFLSRPLRRGSFALVARSGLGASSLAQAARRVSRTFSLLQDDVELEIREDGSLVGISARFSNPDIAQPVFLHALLLRVFWRLLAWMAGGQLRAARFDFAFPPLPDVDWFGEVFPAPIQFDCAQSGFWLHARYLSGPVRREETALRAFLADVQANIIVPRRRNEATSAKVRNHLQSTRPDWPDLGTTATALHMSAPTLQRRLCKEGTSFQALKDELRRDLAIMRLNTSNVSLAVLAQELGFSDSTAFQRAFKAWTGSTPGSYAQSQT